MPTFQQYVEINSAEVGSGGGAAAPAATETGSGLPSGGTAGQVLTLVSQGGQLVPVWLSQPQDFYVFFPGTFQTGQYCYAFQARRVLSFPANFAGSAFTFGFAATSNTVFNILHNDVVIGNITVASGSEVGVFTVPALTLAYGDRLTIELVGAADATLANGDLGLTCTR